MNTNDSQKLSTTLGDYIRDIQYTLPVFIRQVTHNSYFYQIILGNFLKLSTLMSCIL
jgi:hypothetical protein